MTQPPPASNRTFAWQPDPASGITPRWIKAGELVFDVAEALPADPSSRRLALCLHGFPELNISWRHQMPLLAKRGWKVWAPNLRGYGGSDRPTGVSSYAANILAADVAALIAAAEEEAGGPLEVMLVAHDWGALIAWHFAIRHPNMLSKLIIMNVPHPKCSIRQIRRWYQLKKSWYIFYFQLPWLPEAGLRRDNALAIRRVFTGSAMSTDQFPADVLKIYTDAALRPGALTAMLNYYRALLRRRDILDIGDGMVATPTLVVWGEDDAAIDIRALDQLENYVPDLEVHRLPGVSHWVQQDAPDAVNAVMSDWLDRRGG